MVEGAGRAFGRAVALSEYWSAASHYYFYCVDRDFGPFFRRVTVDRDGVGVGRPWW
jgi:hypothetical protein